MAGAFNVRRSIALSPATDSVRAFEKSLVASTLRISAVTPPVHSKLFQFKTMSERGSAKLLTSIVASRPSALRLAAKASFPVTAPRISTRRGVSTRP